MAFTVIALVALVVGFDPRQALQAFASRGLRLTALGYLGHVWELYAYGGHGSAGRVGFTLTVVTIWLILMTLTAVTWRLAFLVLVPGPALGLVAMLRLMRLPETRSIALGRG